jgi:hypothetical protein
VADFMKGYRFEIQLSGGDVVGGAKQRIALNGLQLVPDCYVVL